MAAKNAKILGATTRISRISFFCHSFAAKQGFTFKCGGIFWRAGVEAGVGDVAREPEEFFVPRRNGGGRPLRQCE